MPMSNRQRIIP